MFNSLDELGCMDRAGGGGGGVPRGIGLPPLTLGLLVDPPRLLEGGGGLFLTATGLGGDLYRLSALPIPP